MTLTAGGGASVSGTASGGTLTISGPAGTAIAVGFNGGCTVVTIGPNGTATFNLGVSAGGGQAQTPRGAQAQAPKAAVTLPSTGAGGQHSPPASLMLPLAALASILAGIGALAFRRSPR